LDHFNDPLASISAERLPIATIIPRAWIGFRKAPWSFIGLTALMLTCLMGLGVVARDLQLSSNRFFQYTGDLVLVMAALVPLAPLLALLQLADEHLPGGLDRDPEQPASRRRFLWLLKQTCGLVVLEVLIGIGGISSIRLLSQFLAPSQRRSRQLGRRVGWFRDRHLVGRPTPLHSIADPSRLSPPPSDGAQSQTCSSQSPQNIGVAWTSSRT